MKIQIREICAFLDFLSPIIFDLDWKEAFRYLFRSNWLVVLKNHIFFFFNFSIIDIGEPITESNSKDNLSNSRYVST